MVPGVELLNGLIGKMLILRKPFFRSADDMPPPAEPGFCFLPFFFFFLLLFELILQLVSVCCSACVGILV